MKKKAIIYGLIVLFVIIGAIYFFGRTTYVVSRTIKSPDNVYILEVHTEESYHPTASMSSESGYRKAFVVLKDANGTVIAKPNIFWGCKFLLTDLSTEWDLENNTVYFTKFSYIDINSKSIYCLEP